jgi:hypothetical protein
MGAVEAIKLRAAASHPEDAVADRLEWSASAGGEGLGEDVSGVARIDDPVIPKTRG